MIKVCHVTSIHSRYDGRIFSKECISLAENSYNVSLVVNDQQSDEIIDNVHIYSIKDRAHSSRVGRLLSLNRIEKKALAIDAEIYHLHDPELLLIAKKLKKGEKK